MIIDDDEDEDEDEDEDDIYLMKKAIARLQEAARVNLDLTFVLSGSEALGEIDRNLLDDTLPDKIFLDLNMPGVNGMGVLQHCVSQNILDKVDVVVITTASDPDTHRAALASGTKSVLRKIRQPSEDVGTDFSYSRHNVNIRVVFSRTHP
ncbi:response regulator [Breoghania sp.]|uniref:response regulator n=1 Tax=Breoghania sp. TaxID=2065378 RepID=UPI00261FAD08|nr:response regulator [Breoghania sp.]MDJ0930239.1 response regulator [Breoghania sp.]